MREEGRTEEYHVMGREQQFQCRTQIYSRFTFLSKREILFNHISLFQLEHFGELFLSEGGRG
jgi:hypothetical protein